MTLRLLVGIAAVALSPLAEAGLCTTTAVEKESPYHYMIGLTESLSYAKSGLDRTLTAGRPASDDFEMLLGLKLGKADFECAGSQVSPYLASSNEAIKTSAQGTTFVFSRLADLHEKSVAERKAVLDSMSEGQLKPGTVLERQAELGALYDDVWKLLIPAVIAGTYAVVEVEPKTGRMSRLALTRSQRAEILRKLRATFGPGINKGMHAGQTSLAAAAAVLYQVVGDPKRAPRETP